MPVKSDNLPASTENPKPVEVLQGLECVRRRPGMYLGDTTTPNAVNHVILELVANAIDQFLLGHVTTIDVNIDEGVITVSDDGSLFPFDQPSLEGGYNSLAEYYLCTLHKGATADNHAPHIHLASWGVGLAPLNAVAKKLVIESSNGREIWSQSFSKGGIISPASHNSGAFLKGTTIRLELDPEIFSCLEPDRFKLRKSLFDASHLFPGLAIEFEGARFLAKNGLLELAYTLLKHPSASAPTPRQFHLSSRADDIEFQVAAVGQSQRDTEFRSWTNACATLEGSHVEGFKQALMRTGWMPEIALIHVIMHIPRYAGPCKDILTMKEVQTTISEAITPRLIAAG